MHHFVGADTSRPKGNERELYRPTAQSRYPAGRQIAAPYELRRFFRLPFNRKLRPVTLRAADIRPYGVVHSIQHTLNKERTAVALFSQPYGLPASPQGKLWWVRKLSPFNAPLCLATLRGDKLPPPTDSETFGNVHSTGSSDP